MRFKTILLDLDGTILDFLNRDAYARYEALNQLGHHITLKEVKRHYRPGMGQIDVAKKLGITMTQKETKKYIEISFAHFTEREASNLTRLHKGAYDALSTLSKKCRLVVVTSRDNLSSTEEELERFNIKKFFKLIVTRDVAAQYHRVKQIPLLPFQQQRKKLYQCAVALTKTKPEETLCIGDSVTELKPAKDLGIKTIGVPTGFSSKQDFEKASIPTIQSLKQLSNILKQHTH
jgi:phosphoglycolate phosphatase-like HAD superfamily hydrolase